jgi:hypothetical protein
LTEAFIVPGPDPRPAVEPGEILVGGSAEVLITVRPVSYRSRQVVFDLNVKPWRRFDRDRFNDASADISRDAPREGRRASDTLHYELLFRDGSRASSEDMEEEPVGNTLAMEMLGGGGDTSTGWSLRHRVWPWPVTDSVTLVCEWREFAVPHTMTSVDATLSPPLAMQVLEAET